ncbi:DUF3558 domain-containing protein [Mycobacteroides abscessus]|uniref:Lipoprotein LprB n=1 Tax=Mycobacteroides abscessus subsp. abscessus TaxID=1185650 RepID=A0AB38CUM2_9MYCO|nr:DUF3558 family protein [Mycobacteroides abscessus]AMU57098.1 hypothetical protein A3O02_19385 [Mycobacteroides abscessus]MBE5422995.1 hypothetical protein [Mycobacteroides abscessus]MBE5434249.1 hypothetical protein [Mycobacteroides abscessus]MBE5457265.1 hypothetical protein [Mycobacteroides abscessus]MBE5485386.1 hypothetical protein [Mycobacteroides abscessus]
MDTVTVRMLPVSALVIAAAVLAGCSPRPSSDGDGGSPDAQVTTVPEVNNGPGKGFKLGDCGGMTDAEVNAAVGVPGLKRDVDSLLGCRWSTGPGTGDTSISLYWYRGSSAQKEASVARNLGHTVEAVTTKSYPGYRVSNVGLCELSAGSGPDFLHWSLQSSAVKNDPCRAVETLMDSLLGKVGKQ